MSQETHVIDLRRSYLPMDPNSFASTYHNTQQEDQPESRQAVVPYDGYNFMPTHEGYTSFFGINSYLGITDLPTSGGTGNVDDLFMIQTNLLQNILVALCDDGIWTKQSSVAGAWTHVVTLTVPATGVHKLWSKCVLENTIYAYRQGEAMVYQAGIANSFVFTGFTPSFLNMEGQLGIFKAGGRLGFWDSENSTTWAALGDPTDATPDQETLAGATIFQDIVGRIVVVLQHGTGFIIYCTKSIVLVTRNVSSPLIWQGRAIFNNNGISYREEVCWAEPDTQHFAMTTQGFVEISGGEAKFVIPEVSTYLKEKRDPVYLKMLNGRYLFFPVLDPHYFSALLSFHSQRFPETELSFKTASYSISYPEEGICRSFNAAQSQHEGAYLYNTYGYTRKKDATTPGSVPIWEDHLNTIIDFAILEAWKTYSPATWGNTQYFNDKYTSEGLIPKIDGTGNIYAIPSGMKSVSAYEFQGSAGMHVEENMKSFYLRQDILWTSEDHFQGDWEYSIKHKTLGSYTLASSVIYRSVGADAPDTVAIYSTYSFGPYIDMDWFSESNRYYGVGEKSAWSQRNLTQQLYVDITQRLRYTVISAVEMSWTVFVSNIFGTTGYPASYATYAEMVSNLPGLTATNAAEAEASFTWPGEPDATIVYTFVGITEFSSGNFRIFRVTYSAMMYLSDGPHGPDTRYSQGSVELPGGVTHPATGSGIMEYTVGTTQDFPSAAKFRKVSVDACVYKELGYTQITGHGHYDIASNFIYDNDTDEPADYVDQCDVTPNPKKTQSASFQGLPLASPNGFPCGYKTVTINGYVYTYPDETVIIPSGTNLIQDGSMEPMYPTFIGAFVYDVQYKKWGKMKHNYKQLLDYFPVNNIAGDAPIPYDTFLPKGALLADNHIIYLFDQFPSDSRITFGKFGQYRKGFTDLEEVKILNRTPSSGTVIAEGSLDGRHIEVGIAQAFDFTDATKFEHGFHLSARWYNLTVEGNYDLVNLEVRSSRKGKR